jgi:hypothetical protein
VYVVSLPAGPIWALHSFYLTTTALMLVWYLRYAAPAGRISRSTVTTGRARHAGRESDGFPISPGVPD